MEIDYNGWKEDNPLRNICKFHASMQTYLLEHIRLEKVVESHIEHCKKQLSEVYVRKSAMEYELLAHRGLNEIRSSANNPILINEIKDKLHYLYHLEKEANPVVKAIAKKGNWAVELWHNYYKSTNQIKRLVQIVFGDEEPTNLKGKKQNLLKKPPQQVKPIIDNPSSTFKFENKFNSNEPSEVWAYFHKELIVEKKLLSEEVLKDYLKQAFEVGTPPIKKFSFSKSPLPIGKIKAVFHKYYEVINLKPRGKKPEYEKLLVEYFNGFKYGNFRS